MTTSELIEQAKQLTTADFTNVNALSIVCQVIQELERYNKALDKACLQICEFDEITSTSHQEWKRWALENETTEKENEDDL